jgi:hypothetical protein
MPSLLETQALISGALLRGDGAYGATSLLRAGRGVAAERRLHVYRNNLFASLGAALAAVYPVVTRLVGDDFFRQLARDYVVRHPSRSGNLHEFGAQLPAYLRRQAALAALPYLADVAALEWASHEVYHEADEAPFDAEALARLPVDAQARLRLHLQLATRFVASPFPVLAIWQANQAAASEDVAPVSLDAGAVRLLVARRDFEVEFRVLGGAEDRFLRALAEGRTLPSALHAALATDARFDVGATLGRHFALGSFRAWSLADVEDRP